MKVNSKFRLYSVGIVVETKKQGDPLIKVSPIEELNIQKTGFIFSKEKTFVGDKESVDKVDFDTKHISKNYVQAKWKAIGNGNRSTAPDVVAGETVVLYKYANIDEYWWDEVGYEPDMRRLEDVLWSFSNVPKGIGKETFTPDTSYWVRVNTKDKFIHIHSSDNDGEATTWDMHLNTKAGTLRIEDGKGNFQHWDAVAGTHESTFNTKITRNAPTIIENCIDYFRNTTNIEDNSTNHYSNSSIMVDNTTNRTINSSVITENSQINVRNTMGIVDNTPMLLVTGNEVVIGGFIAGAGRFVVPGSPANTPPPITRGPVGGGGTGGLIPPIDGDIIFDTEARFNRDVEMRQNADVWWDLDVGKNTEIKGTLDTTGNSTLRSNLQVHKNTNIDGTLDVTLDSHLKKNLQVDINTNIDGTLDVTKDTHLKKNLQVDINTNIDGTLDVTKDTHLKEDLQVDINTNIDGTLDVTKDTHLKEDLQVDFNTNIDGTLDVTLNTHLKKNLQVNINTNIDGTLDVTLNTHLKKNLQVDFNTNIDGTLGVTLYTYLKDHLRIDKTTHIYETLTVEGDTTLKGDLHVENSVVIDKDLEVKRNATIPGYMRSY